MQDAVFKTGDLPRVTIVKTTPKATEEQLFSYKRCYMGISLDNPDFYGKSLEALLLWVTANYEQCLIVIGDYLRRYNEQIFSGKAGQEEEKASLEAGEIFLQKSGEILRKYSEPKIKIIKWKDCISTPQYKTAKEILDKLYQADENFRASLQKDAFSFINRQKRKKQNPKVAMEEAIEISSRYLLEEVAVFSSLAELGWNIEVYPGPELGVLVDIAKGNFSNIPVGLKNRINIELHVDKSQK